MSRHDLIALVHRPDLAPENPALQLISGNGFTAVLDAEPRPIMSLPKSRATALAAAARRQAQLESLMPVGTVLPVRPGTALRPETVRTTIAANLPLLDDVANWLTGLVQYQITVSWDEKEVIRHFRDTPEIAPLFDAPRLDQTRLTTALNSLMARLRREMRGKLGGVAPDIIPLPVAEGMLLNLVVLVPAADQDRLDHALHQIDAIWPEGLAIRQIGPSPATSFGLLTLTEIDATDITAARRCLNLEEGSALSLQEARRKALMAGDADTAAIRHACDLLDAVARLERDHGDFSLIRVLSQDQGETALDRAAVA